MENLCNLLLVGGADTAHGRSAPVGVSTNLRYFEMKSNLESFKMYFKLDKVNFLLSVQCYMKMAKYPIEKIVRNKKYKVIITFVEEFNNEEENLICNFWSNGSGFSFLENKDADIYQDYLISVKNK